jgi:LPPG:FO 2-phospho-L-lactate transferase
MTKVVALAGGVGGAKLVWGLSKLFSKNDLTVIVNTGDDFVHYGLNISPDLDTVCYALADLANPQTGWGRAEETWNCLNEIKKLGGTDWFALGDRDLAWHLERTRLMQTGMSLSAVTRHLCQLIGIVHPVLPMSDQPVRTLINTKEYGVLPFQEYFVKYQCQPTMIGCNFEGIEDSRLPDEGQKALEGAEMVIICPSNPWVSIDPILGIKNVRQLLTEKATVAVSPIIGGKTIKGPAAKMFQELGIEPGSLAVAQHYQGLIKGIVIDIVDKSQMQPIRQCGIIPIETDTIMSDNDDRVTLARKTVDFCNQFMKV